MKQILINLIVCLLIVACNTDKYNDIDENLVVKFSENIKQETLKELLYLYASKKFEGRETGTAGQRKASEFLKSYYIKHNILSPLKNEDYFQNIPKAYFDGHSEGKSENVIAYIKGSDKPEEVVIISAHLDHLGRSKNGAINYGADDDGSGTVAILEIANAFNMAVKKGYRPKRSIMFLHVTGEEIGLYGSKYYTQVNPVFNLKTTVANLNIDMIGRIDDKHIENRNYLYLIGSNKLSQDLHNMSELVNKRFTNIDLDYTYNKKNDPNRFYYRSDHYNFAKQNIPVIFYFSGLHKDYHRHTDTPDKIEYDLLEKRTKLIFCTTWYLANANHKINLN